MWNHRTWHHSGPLETLTAVLAPGTGGIAAVIGVRYLPSGSVAPRVRLGRSVSGVCRDH